MSSTDHEFAYLRTLTETELYAEYSKAEQEDDIALAVAIMHESDRREFL